MSIRMLRLRRGGARLPDSHPDSDWVSGAVSMATVAGGPGGFYRFASFKYDGDTSVQPARHELFEPAVIAMTNDRVLLRGYERVGQASMAQEWLIDFRGP